MAIQLGDKVVDVVSGFKGVVTGRAEYLTGCSQFSVSAESDGQRFQTRRGLTRGG